jgi:prepilin-type N-terminal cleavage/methylation domain-containing protein
LAPELFPMIRSDRTPSPRIAVTLIELIVVLAIIAILLGLLFPALHYARELSRRAACAGNLHQLGIAMTHYVEVRRKLPDVAPDGAIGGWAIAILPFMEDTSLADGLSGNPPLDPVAPLALARKRPVIMTCPSAYEGDSAVATVPASHYTAVLVRHQNHEKTRWQMGELMTDSRIPWVTSPEVPFGGLAELRPHRGGYNFVSGYGATSNGVGFSTPDD